MHRRALIRRVALVVALGTATTLLVAYACAYRATDFAQGPFATRSGERLTNPRGVEVFDEGGRAPPNSQYLELRLYERFGASFGLSRLRAFSNYTPAAPPRRQTPPEQVATRWERAVLLPWLDGRRPWPDPTKGDRIWAKASGWPFRCCVCTIHITNAPNFTSHTWSVRGGVILSNSTFPGWADWPPTFPRIIPLRPMWPELLLNIATFSAAWWLICLLAIALRRALLKRVGHCPTCGYDLRGLIGPAPCPECGNTVALALATGLPSILRRFRPVPPGYCPNCR